MRNGIIEAKFWAWFPNAARRHELKCHFQVLTCFTRSRKWFTDVSAPAFISKALLLLYFLIGGNDVSWRRTRRRYNWRLLNCWGWKRERNYYLYTAKCYELQAKKTFSIIRMTIEKCAFLKITLLVGLKLLLFSTHFSNLSYVTGRIVLVSTPLGFLPLLIDLK